MKHSRPGFGVIHDDGIEEAPAATRSPAPLPFSDLQPGPSITELEQAKRAAEARSRQVQPQTQVIPQVKPRPLRNAQPDPVQHPRGRIVPIEGHPLKLEVSHD